MDTAHEETASALRYASNAVGSRPPLDHFSSTIFKNLRRIDQRKWAHAYLYGLLVTSGKKSVRRIASAISRDPSVAQSLRQFVSLSPWDFDEVMEELTHWVSDHRPDPVWSIGRTVLPKRGDQSVGVHRYFDPDSGRTLNCQLGLGSFLCVGPTQVPVDWCLHLPRAWTQDRERRGNARIPDSEPYRPGWAHALLLVDRLSTRTDCTSSVVLVDMSNEPDVWYLLHGLAKRRRDFVVAVPSHLAVLPVGEGVPAPVSARTLVSAQSTETDVVPLPDGRQRIAHLRTSLVHLPGSSQGRSSGPPYRLFTEVGPTRASGSLWLTSLAHRPLAEVGSIAALHTGTTAAIDCLKRDFGLLDYEGRSFPGWYHHMALISAAYTFRSLHGAITVPPRDTAQRVP
ncbi:transposase [Streptomyces sp. SID3343]|uniref:IS701 family transposase n=1 Tax=Streptomyces sp. SID3343 TaxID=2690260 RepID=UPI00136A7178|nr:transposase [Streptomyces sp. SID3343]MYV97955.1 transposase [Streptomyces sp. SID3343]